jgi:hypothetical protein
MALRQYKSRIHLLAAKDAPAMVILQRKRDKLFHVITINTQTLRITEGSWFRGKLYPLRCDVSFDGTFMVYLAMGARGQTWNGVCRLPWLTTLVDVENTGTWYGGGFFAGRRALKTNGWGPHEAIANRANIPFRLEAHASRYGGEDLGVIYERFERDGFKRLGEAWGEQRTLSASKYTVECVGDDGWGRRPSRQHPELKVRFIGYLEHGYTFAFSLDKYPDLLEGARWATWDANGKLWVAWPGVVARYTRDDLRRGKPSFSLDVDRLEPPAREPAQVSGGLAAKE